MTGKESQETVKIAGKGITREVTINGKLLSPVRSQKIVNHSPDGFSWGYGGSGPAQLSLAILLECVPEDDAISYYQIFKWKVIAGLEQPDFEIDLNVALWMENEKYIGAL